MTSIKATDCLLNWPTRQDWINDIMPDFYQHGLAVLSQAIPAQLCQALLEEVSQKQDLTAAGVGRAAALQQNTEIRRDQTAWLDGSSERRALFEAYGVQVEAFLRAYSVASNGLGALAETAADNRGRGETAKGACSAGARCSARLRTKSTSLVTPYPLMPSTRPTA
mgnify:CR=1 FL=1